MLKISEFFWNYMEKYRYHTECSDYMYHIMYFCLKGYLESSKQKYYIFKLALILNEKTKNKKVKPQSELLRDLR